MPSGGLGDGWEHIFFNVTAENQRRADERIPLLLELPFRHKGVMCAPLIGEVRMERYLASGQIEQVLCEGENYDGARPCHYTWVKRLREECEAHDVTFVFLGTGRRFVKDGKLYCIERNSLQSQQAYRSGLTYLGRPMEFLLCDDFGYPIPEEERYHPVFCDKCATCGMRPTCNGCTNCGKCKT